MPPHDREAASAHNVDVELAAVDVGPPASRRPLIALPDHTEVPALFRSRVGMTKNNLLHITVDDLDRYHARTVVIGVCERGALSLSLTVSDGATESNRVGEHSSHVCDQHVVGVGRDRKMLLTIRAVQVDVFVPDVAPVHHHELITTGDYGELRNGGELFLEAERINSSHSFLGRFVIDVVK